MREDNGLLGTRIATLLAALVFALTSLVFGSEQTALLPTGSIVLAASGGVVGKDGGHAKASASASASATTRSASSGQTGGCEARSSAEAHAEADGERMSDRDQDAAHDEGDGCVARSEAKAEARVGGSGTEGGARNRTEE
ncbi:MAG TPA: hypothetical protein VE592_08550 [Geminicoccaceae bacterium]|jgi:hypothetical protein|nr:hypothetical protein [Geminicoccaceae bacterium]